jgi:predicted cobalt transporter CbtA
MFRTIVFSAFGAALAVGLALSVLQAFTTEPLILHAEEFEGTRARRSMRRHPDGSRRRRMNTTRWRQQPTPTAKKLGAGRRRSSARRTPSSPIPSSASASR